MTVGDTYKDYYFIEVQDAKQPGVPLYYENEEGFCMFDPNPSEGCCVFDIKEATLFDVLEETRNVAQAMKERWKSISSISIVRWRVDKAIETQLEVIK